MSYVVLSFLLLISTFSFGQQAEKPSPDDVQNELQQQYEQKIRRLEDSLLVEKTRQAERQALSKETSLSKIEEEQPENMEEALDEVGKDVGKTVTNFRNILNPTKILTIVLVLFFTWLIVRSIAWFFDRMIAQFPHRRLQFLGVKPIIAILIWFIAIFSLIKTLFDSNNLWAAAGASGLGLAFALQDIAKNIFGGLMILINRPFQVGDRVEVKGSYGEVVKIGLQTTTINTLDDNLVSVPNSAIVSESVSNANAGALDCMVVVDLWLPINIKVEKVRSLAFESAITSRYLNIDKPVTVLFFDHFDQQAATNVKIKAYVLDARYEKLFAGDVTETAKKAFAEAGIYTSN